MRPFAVAVAVATSLAVAAAAHAGPQVSPDEGEAYVTGLGERVVAVCQTRTLSTDQRRLKVGRAIAETIDFTTMSGLILADSVDYASRLDKQAFVRLFTAFFLEEMLEELGSVEVVGFTIDEVEPMRDGDVIVETTVALADGDSFNAGWRVRNVDGTPRIVDMLVKGFSVATHFSRLFERRSRRDIDRLNDYLMNRVAGSRMLALVK